ncbi:MAG: hypothetical protein ABIS51_13600 [Sphingomonas sp.]
MAEVLILGISHYPMLLWPDKGMAGLLKKMLTNPNLPEALKTPAGWPEAMRKEWGSDDGEAAAAAHRKEMMDWTRQARQAVDDFNPDFVLIWGDDQYENFKEDIVPPYCINAHPEFRFHNFPNNIWGEPVDKEFVLPGAQPAAKHLASELIAAGFDAAYSYKPLHHALGHAFTNAIFYLDYDRKGFNYPILPVSINCYGRQVIAQKGGLPVFGRELTDADLDPPAPTPGRLFDMGAETARILAKSPYRVALVASSSWSHAFLTKKTHYLWPDIPADRALFDAMVNRDYDVWRNYTSAQIEDSGQQEVLNWSCLLGAMSALDRGEPDMAAFMETWIFNSCKAFLVSKP